MKLDYSYPFLCRFSVTFKAYTRVLICLLSEFYTILSYFGSHLGFLQPFLILFMVIMVQNVSLYIKCSLLRILSFIQEIQPIVLVFGGHLGFWRPS